MIFVHCAQVPGLARPQPVLNWPLTGQKVHCLQLTWPTWSWNWGASQNEHVLESCLLGMELAVPAGQLMVMVEPDGQYPPALQGWHWEALVAPVVPRKVPAVQLVQADCPVAALNVPAGHGMRSEVLCAPEFGMNLPASAAIGAEEPAGQ
jgi:hypothetical protein